MDSGNSGSMQSSSGGDEEYDSRADETISPFFNHHHPSLTFTSISNHPPPPNLSHHHHNHPPPTLFDPHPQPHNLVSFSHSPSNNPIFPNPNTTTTSTSSSSSLYNINLDSSVWSRSGLRSEPNPNYTTDFGTLPSSSSLTQSQLGLHGPNQGPFPTSSSPPPMPLPPSNISGGRGGGGGATSSSTTTTTTSRSDQINAVKNSRKRTRASRRAPTTVLTTDTSNFRQMVQEFTGIPAPPFSASSSPYSRRLDLFGAGSAALRSGHLDTLGPLYPFRPSAQKLQFHLQQSPPPPFLSSSSTSNIINIANASSTSNTNNSYQIPSSDQTILNNLQNPILTFLQKSSLDDHLGMTSNSTSTTSHHENVSANLGGFNPSHHGNLRWRGEETSNGGQDHLQLMGDQAQNVSISSYNKLDGSSVSASGFQPEKGGLGTVSTRNEGMVDSWICPSDLDLCTNKQFS